MKNHTVAEMFMLYIYNWRFIVIIHNELSNKKPNSPKYLVGRKSEKKGMWVVIKYNKKYSTSLLLFCLWVVSDSWAAACQAFLSLTISWSLLKFMSIESVMPSNHLILCHCLLLPSIFPSIRVFSNELAVCISLSISNCIKRQHH